MIKRLWLVVLRDLFAVFAPKKPQRWFVPEMPLYPAPEWSCSGTNQHTPGCCGDPDICGENNWRERQQWKAEAERQRWKQWPYAWADAMLAERGK